MSTVYETLTKGDVQIELLHEGEGISGDFGEVPNDKPRLRLTVYKKVSGEWEQVDDGSVCTLLDQDMPAAPKIQLLSQTMREVYDKVVGDESIKKIMEELSWFEPPVCPR